MKRIRQIMSWLLVFIMLVNAVSVPSMAASSVHVKRSDYYDINSHWAESQIDRLISEHVVNGSVKEGVLVIEPDKSITRAEYVVLTLKGMFSETELKKQIEQVQLNEKFFDIQDHWAEAYIELAYKLGLIKGYTDGSFKPNVEISRAEAVTIMVLSNKDIQGEMENNLVFIDISEDYWAYSYISKAKASGLVSGYPNNTFKPNAQITRGESMVITDRYIDYISEKAYLSALSKLEVTSSQSNVSINRTIRFNLLKDAYEIDLSNIRRHQDYNFEIHILEGAKDIGTLSLNHLQEVVTLNNNDYGKITYEIIGMKANNQIGRVSSSDSGKKELATVKKKESKKELPSSNNHHSEGRNNSFHNTVIKNVPSAPQIDSSLLGRDVKLNWQSIKDADTYEIKRGEKSGNYSVLATVSGTSYTDTTRIDGTTYYYVVTAVNSKGSSANSNEIVYKTVPKAPKLFGTQNGANALINWSTSNGADNYVIYRSSVQGGPYYELDSNLISNSFTDSGIQSNTTYYYVIRAINDLGESEYSNEVAVGTNVASVNVFNPSLDDDGDGLTNDDELLYGTRRYDNDTDRDGLDDGSEIQVGTNPLNPDTDSDGTYDGAETTLGTNPLVANNASEATKKASTNDGRIKVVANGDGNLIVAPLQVTEVDNVLLESMDGIVGKPIDITSGGYDIDNASITFSYNESDLGEINEADLTVFYVNPETSKLEPLENIVIDTDSNTVTGITTHFSMYLLGDKSMIVDLSKIDIVFAIDQSGSMKSNDPNYYRIKATKRFIEEMDENKNRAGIVTFDNYGYIKNVLSNDKTELLDTIKYLKYANGSTYMAKGLEKSISLFNEADRRKVIILLTDGQASDNPDYQVDQATRNNIIINTVALGSGADEDALQQIAKDTKGGYFYINNGNNLSQEDVDKQIELIYQKLAKQLAFTSISEENDALPKSLVNLEFSDLYNGYESKEVQEWVTGAQSNLLTGNYVYQNTDMVMQGPGFNITVDRTYNSFGTNKGLFGYGFTSNLESSIMKDDSDKFGSVIAASLNVRSSVGVKNNKIGQLSKGMKVEILDNSAGGSSSRPWFKIKYNGKDAYVAGWYISEKEALHVSYPTGSRLIFNYNESGDRAITSSSDDIVRIGQHPKYEYELVKKDQSVFYYDADGKVRAYSDRYGNPVTFDYNSKGQIVKLTDAFKGRSVDISYNGEGYISKITDTMGRRTKYDYDDQGKMVSFADMENQVTKYEYDKSGRITKVTDANGHQVVRNNYDLLGRMVRQYDGQNNIKYFIYDDNIDEENSISARYIIDENGNESKITFGPGLRPITVRDALGGLTEYTYYYKESDVSEWIDISSDVIVRKDSNVEYSDTFKDYQEKSSQMQLQSREKMVVYRDVDSLGDKNDTELITITDRDGFGNVVQIKDAKGNTETFEYDDYNNLVKQKDKTGNTTQYVYEDKVFLVEEIDALNQKSEHLYYSQDMNGGIVIKGLLKQKIDHAGSITTYKYDHGFNQMSSMIDAEGNTTKFTYDIIGRKLTETDGNDYLTEYIYDDMNRVTIIKLPDGSEKHNEYDGVGNLIREIDFEGQITEYAYDEENKLEKQTDPLGNTTTFAYDPAGNKVKETYADSGTTEIKYDALNRMIEQTNPLGHSEKYTYDSVDNVIEKEDARGFKIKYIYDLLNQVTSELGPEGQVAKYSYDANGNVISIEDGRRNEIYFTFDALNRQVRVTDDYGKYEEIVYEDALKRVTSIDKLGRNTVTQLDGLGRTIEVIDALGNKAVIKYDAVGNPIESINPAGTVTKSKYDSRNQLIESKLTYDPVYIQNASNKPEDAGESFNKIITFEYDKNGNKTKEVDALGNATVYAYDANNQLIRETLSDGSTAEYVYDSMGRMTEMKDPNNHRTEYIYDLNGQLLSEANALGHETGYTYDKSGNQIVIEDAEGNRTTVEYDGHNRKIRVTDAKGNYETYEYDVTGNNVSRTDKNGNTSEFEYDDLNRLKTVIDPYNNTIRTKYDAVGNVIEERDAKGNRIKKQYDALNHVVEIEDQMGETETFVYDVLGNVIKQTNKNGDASEFFYDALSQLIRVTDAEGTQTRYTFDLAGNVTSMIDGRSSTWITEYDERYRPVLEIDPSGTQMTYTYDAMGNMVSRVNKNGVRSELSYDATGNLLSEKHGDIIYEYSYDAVGNLLKVNEDSKVTLYEYDTIYNTIKKTLPGGETLSYSYDAMGNETHFKDITGESTEYTFDNMNRMSTVTTSGETSTYDYDKNGNRVKLTLGNGTYTEYAFDKANRLIEMSNFVEIRDADFLSAVKSTSSSATQVMVTTSAATQVTTSGGTIVNADNGLPTDGESITINVSGQNVIDISGKDYLKSTYIYVYDANGYQLSKAEPKGTTRYTYDSLGRLKTVDEPTGRLTEYTYDKSGNRATQTVKDEDVDSSIEYTYDIQNRLLETTEIRNGVETLTEYKYDVNGNQIEVKETTGDTVTKSTYAYDALHRMIKTTTDDGKVIENAYDFKGLRVSKTVDGMKNKYFYNGDQLIVEESNGQTVRVIQGVGILAREGTQLHYYLYNGHADVVAIVNADGVMTNQYDYDVFGNVILSEEGYKNTFKYAGYMYDDETGYYYLKARYYDPEIARFITEDTYRGEYSDTLSLNRYTYGHNNPVLYNDPNGHWINIAIGAVIGGIAGFVTTAITNRDASLGTYIVNTLGGAAGGAVVAAGGGMIATALGAGEISGATAVGSMSLLGATSNMGVSITTQVADDIVNSRDIDVDGGEVLINGAAGAVTGLLSGFGSVAKNVSKVTTDAYIKTSTESLEETVKSLSKKGYEDVGRELVREHTNAVTSMLSSTEYSNLMVDIIDNIGNPQIAAIMTNSAMNVIDTSDSKYNFSEGHRRFKGEMEETIRSIQYYDSREFAMDLFRLK